MIRLAKVLAIRHSRWQKAIPYLFAFLGAVPLKAADEGRVVTVDDAIRMTRLADHAYFAGGSIQGRVAHFSPDGKRFFLVLRKGDPNLNTNIFSLFLYQTSQAFDAPRGDLVLTMSSNSNRDAIKDPRWLNDNKRVAFIGEQPDKIPQVYVLDVDTKRIRNITNHSTPVVAFGISDDGRRLVFEGDPARVPVINSQPVRRGGVTITNQDLVDILAGESHSFRPSWTLGEQLFVQRQGKSETLIPTNNLLYSDFDISVSPDGRYAIVLVHVRTFPQAWLEYSNENLEKDLNEKTIPGRALNVRQYVLLDLTTGKLEPLLETPLSGSNNAVEWSPDSDSVAVTGIFLPLNTNNKEERKTRSKEPQTVEIRISDRQINSISDDEDLMLLKWDRSGLVFKSSTKGEVWFSRTTGAGWARIAGKAGPTNTATISLEEDMNTPPKVVVVEPGSNRKSVLVELNPQFAALTFAKVEAIKWKATDSHEVEGGLYWPPNYVPGNQYPLVIQTHGFDPNRFLIDGPWSTSFAAQPLANRGFFVLQVGASRDPDEAKYFRTPEEGPRGMAAYEGAIDYLDSLGLIDRNRVAIIGFSRTVYDVGFTLTHSKYRFAAATLADGIDGGYFQFLAFFGDGDEKYLNGGAPYGAALRNWIKRAPGFNLDSVHTPVRLEALNPVSVLEMWEWFSGLSQLSKPVDFIYLPFGTHLLVKPWERHVSQQGTVDWISFWLKDQVDPDPAKVSQYGRWRKLRKLQEAETN